MSIHENIQFFHRFDVNEYMEVLRENYGVKENPNEPGSLIFGETELPFYEPQVFGDHVSILSFNYVPLPNELIQALIDHPELAPDNMVVCWTQEQDLILESTLGELRNKFKHHVT